MVKLIMLNDYLSNKKNYILNKPQKNYFSVPKTLKSKKIDINILLNKAKVEEKNKKKENLILFALTFLIISVVGIFTTI